MHLRMLAIAFSLFGIVQCGVIPNGSVEDNEELEPLNECKACLDLNATLGAVNGDSIALELEALAICKSYNMRPAQSVEECREHWPEFLSGACGLAEDACTERVHRVYNGLKSELVANGGDIDALCNAKQLCRSSATWGSISRIFVLIAIVAVILAIAAGFACTRIQKKNQYAGVLTRTSE